MFGWEGRRGAAYGARTVEGYAHSCAAATSYWHYRLGGHDGTAVVAHVGSRLRLVVPLQLGGVVKANQSNLICWVRMSGDRWGLLASMMLCMASA